jgi:GntR family transcriptional regulator
MSHQLPARAARWPLSLAPLGGDRRRWLARARRAGLDEASIEASYRDAFLARTKEETL